MKEEAKERSRILIVSNRLPVGVKATAQGIEFQPSSGGLVSGLSSLHDVVETLWIGWPGSVRRDDQNEVRQKLRDGFGCHPVFISQQLSEKYYEGYSNRTIWPLFHSMSTYAKYSATEWEAYKKANAIFAEEIVREYRPGDRLWIHDYHLMLVPRLVREQLPNVALSFFLHIPFPHYDIFRLLPQHREILESLLALDLIGFHTHDYSQAFLGTVRRLLGYDNTLGQLLVGERAVQVDVFPMGIDFRRYADGTRTKAVRSEISSMMKSLRSRKMVFSVSRLDYTKGIPESLEAIRDFFTKNPQWREKLMFILVVVPSRERVERYASLKREIDELVGRINSEFSTLDWTPIRYVYQSLPFSQLIALYACADVALVTPLRDGMNLIAKEYLAVKSDNHGVLILSEVAGAAKELLEAIMVNPNSKEEISDALAKALDMPLKEQEQRNKFMRQRLETHDIHRWVKHSFERLDEILNATRMLSVKLLDRGIREKLLHDYAAASRRLLVLDYDGTLVPFADQPHLARTDAQLVEVLGRMTKNKKNQVVILSGRDRWTLQEWLGELNLTLVAEHGGWARVAGGDWQPAIVPKQNKWKKDIRPILQLYVDRIPGSFIEEKNFSLVWHYRKADAESASMASKELLDTLANFSMNMGVQILPGNKTVEVRNIGISKGIYYTNFLSSVGSDFTLAAGDDWTDEDLFSVLPESAYSIKVGMRVSKAKYNMKSYLEVRSLLDQLEG